MLPDSFFNICPDYIIFWYNKEKTTNKEHYYEKELITALCI